MKKLVSLILVLCMALSLVSCGKSDDAPAKEDTSAPGTSEPAPEKEGYEEVLYIASEENFERPDPYSTTIAVVHQFTNMTFNTLVSVSPADSSISPELATKWTDVNGDGLCWEFDLVENAVFHDGSPFTAEDVVFTWNYVTDVNNVMRSFSGTAVSACEKIEAVDTYKVRFTLSQPVADFVAYMGELKIYSKTAFDTLGAEKAALIGTGPYVFNADETKNGVQVVADKFEQYWGNHDDYKTKKIVYKIYGSTDTMVAALQAGEVDVFYNVPASQMNTLNADSNIKTIMKPGTYSYYLGFNFKKNTVLNDLTVRKAIAMACDKEAMVAIAFDGFAAPSNCAVIPAANGYTEGYTYYEHDPAAAKAMLEEAGYKDLKFVVSYPTAATKLMGEVLQANLAEIGIQVELLAVDVKNWTEHKNSNDYDMFLDAFNSTGAMLYNVNRMFYTGGSANNFKYSNPDYEALQDKVAAMPTLEGMKSEFLALEQFLNDDLPVAPLLYDQYLVSMRADVEDALGEKGADFYVCKNMCDFSSLYIPAR